MAYRYSHVDNKNLKWFSSDNCVASLHRIQLTDGHLRSLMPFTIKFTYPISAVAGENGSGKSTLLAIAACAFHNIRQGFRPLGKKNTYYTFSDFFIQSSEDVPPQGIRIRYQILHNKWKRIGAGLGWQERRKRVGGKWNNYDSRASRNIAFLGIARVVPPSERSTLVSYRSYFSPGSLDLPTRQRMMKIAGKIIGKSYTDFDLHEHSKYSLPVVAQNNLRYSGFNMGAGENGVFEILTVLFKAGRGALLVIDEIGLGLHDKAQRRLIEELKKLCESEHCQIICSTHSPTVLASLPPEARFLIQKSGSDSVITSGISPEFATGKLAGKNSDELCIFVEDDVAQAFLAASLPLALRERIGILPIGSSEAVLRQLAARFLEKKGNCLAILDGDKRSNNTSSLNKIVNYSEASNESRKKAVREWSESRLAYLPGDTWPEKWLLETLQHYKDKTDLTVAWIAENEEQVDSAIEAALRAEKHDEFRELGSELSQDEAQVRTDVIRFVIENEEDALTDILDHIKSLIEE